MILLAFDTETSGVKSSDDLTKPHDKVLQIAAQLIEVDAIPTYPYTWTNHATFKTLVDHPGVVIPEGAKAVHKIDEALCARYGMAPEDAAFAFAAMMRKADAFLGHNLGFDVRMMRHFFHDEGFEGEPFGNRPIFDTMKVSTDICRIKHPRGSGYKWPKLTEAHRFYTHWEMQRMNPDYNVAELDAALEYRYANAHDAMIDTDMAIEVFFGYARYTGNDFGIGFTDAD